MSVQKLNLRDLERVVIASAVDPNWPGGLGLGNQFMTYALAYSFAAKIGADTLLFHHDKILLDDSLLSDSSRRDCGLRYFLPEESFVQSLDEVLLQRQEGEVFELSDLASHDLGSSDFGSYSAFIVPLLFENDVTDVIESSLDSLRNKLKYRGPLASQSSEMLDLIKGTRSASIHYRRGDYLEHGWDVPVEFQFEAAYYLCKKDPELQFFIFSDDIAYVKDCVLEEGRMRSYARARGLGASDRDLLFQKLENAVFVSKVVGHPVQEFHLMSQCRYNIVPQSTFSWWAALLNENPSKVVVFPEPLPGKKYEMNFPRIPRQKGWVQLKYHLQEF